MTDLKQPTDYLPWIVAVLGLIALVGALWRMQNGFGPFNTRIVGIVLVATFATLLGLKESGALTAAMGILGAIGGYLFGIRTKKDDDG